LMKGNWTGPWRLFGIETGGLEGYDP